MAVCSLVTTLLKKYPKDAVVKISCPVHPEGHKFRNDRAVP